MTDFWNSDSSVSLRREVLAGVLDKACSVCKSQNVEPPEEVVPDIYTHHTIVCDHVLGAGRLAKAVVPTDLQPLRQWPGSSVRFAGGITSASRPCQIELMVEFHPGGRRPELFFLRDSHDETVASASGVPEDEGKSLVEFEVGSASPENLRDLHLVAMLPEGERVTIPWKDDEQISLDGAVFCKGSQKYPVLSDLPIGSHLVGHLDECHFIGNTLRCKGWAFDTRFRRSPDLIALFSGPNLLTMSASKGERYDVARALSAPEAVSSGFFIISDLLSGPRKKGNIAEVAAIALFEQAHYAFLVGTAQPSG